MRLREKLMFGNNAPGEYELSFRNDGKLVSGTFHVESGLVTATMEGRLLEAVAISSVGYVFAWFALAAGKLEVRLRDK
jgi:amino acid permease